MSTSENNKPEKFRIVPQTLTASKKFTDIEYRILAYCIGTMNIKLANDEPFTHSAMSLAGGTGKELRTIQRIVKRFVKLGILKRYGWKLNGKQYYPVYDFQLSAVEAILKSVPANETIKNGIPSQKQVTSKMSSLIPIENIDDIACLEQTIEASNDRSGDKNDDIEVTRIKGKKGTVLNTEYCNHKSVIINQASAKAIEEPPAVPVGSISTPAASVCVGKVSTTASASPSAAIRHHSTPAASVTRIPNENLADAFEALFNTDGSIR